MSVPRKSGASASGFHFLLLFSANGKPVFVDDDDRRRLNGIVAAVVAELQVRVHAHCWLNNEIELVAETGPVSPERLIRKIAVTYTDAVAGRLGRNGSLFADNPIAYEPGTRAELVDVVRSLHVRPVVLDLAEECLNYPWSSVRAYRGLDELPWLTKEILGPLLEHNDPCRSQAPQDSHEQTAPRMIADALDAKLSREMVDRSRIWMARALIAWVVTRNDIAGMDVAAARLGVDATSLERSMRKYREISPDLFQTPLTEVMNWHCFESASPKARKDIAAIFSTLREWAPAAALSG